MNKFIQQLGERVVGVLRGFDRVRFRGTLRMLANGGGLITCLESIGVELEHFGAWAEKRTKEIVRVADEVVKKAGRPHEHVPPKVVKEALAREIAERDGITSGLICSIGATELCMTLAIVPIKETGRLVLRPRTRQCLHLYHYYQDPMFGFMHVRLQTWLPYTVTICINGREWLARQMDSASLSYCRVRNCFPELADPEAAQALMDQQLRTNWAKCFDEVASRINPSLNTVFPKYPMRYYWCAESSEWATDLMFAPGSVSPDYLEALIRNGVAVFQSRDVFRFLGRKLTIQQKIHGSFQGEVTTKYIRREEGTCVKHRLGKNSVKMYSKATDLLRVETTINDPGDFKVYRKPQGNPKADPDWLPLRKGVADMYRRAKISDASNERYLKKLAAVERSKNLAELLDSLCQRASIAKRAVRAMNPFSAEDQALLMAIASGEFTINGFRNRDLRALLYGSVAKSPDEYKRQSRAVTRKLRLLRAHGLIAKVGTTHRYHLTDYGRELTATVLAARTANAKKLLKMAA